MWITYRDQKDFHNDANNKNNKKSRIVDKKEAKYTSYPQLFHTLWIL